MTAPPTSARAPVLDESTFAVLHPLEYERRYLAAGVRPDGRPPLRPRAVVAAPGQVSTADGSAVVRVGSTSVMCGVQCLVMTPTVEAPTHGAIEVAVHLTPLCSARYALNRPPEAAAALSRLLAATLAQGRVLDLGALCIAEGRAAWHLAADVVCLDDDGNVTDAATIALVAALCRLRLPRVVVGEDGVVTRVEGAGTPLVLRVRPVPLTCVLLEGALLVDPCAAEEDLAGASVTVLRAAGGEVCGLHVGGGGGGGSASSSSSNSGGELVPMATVRRCLDLAAQRVAAVDDVYRAISADA